VIRRAALVLALVACAQGVALAQDADAYGRARALALDHHWAEAITLLRDRLTSAPVDVDSRVLLGTVLSWDGQYDAARTELTQALASGPDNTDALAALMNVELWSSHPRTAYDLAVRALNLAPTDSRFIEGRRRAQSSLDQLRPWQVSFTDNTNWFSDDRGTWKESQLWLRRATPVGPVIVRTSHADRFGLSDDQFELEMYPRIRAGTYAYVSAGAARRGDLYPNHRIAADLYQSLGAGYEVFFGVRRLVFDTPTMMYVGGLSRYMGNWLVTGRTLYIPDAGGQRSTSFYASVRRYFGADGTDYVGAQYGHGASRQEIRDVNDFLILHSDTVGAEFLRSLTRNLGIQASLSVSRGEQAGSSRLSQTSGSVGLNVRF
jgi:YaiO family outer membrane protein